MRQLSSTLLASEILNHKITLTRVGAIPVQTPNLLDVSSYVKSLSNITDKYEERKGNIAVGSVSVEIPLTLFNPKDQSNFFYNYYGNKRSYGTTIDIGYGGSLVRVFSGRCTEIEKTEAKGKFYARLTFAGWGKELDDTKLDDLKDPNTSDYYKNIYLIDLLGKILDEASFGGDQELTAPTIEFAKKSWDFYKAFKKSDDGVSPYDAGDKVTAHCYDTLRSRNYVGIDNEVYYFDSATRDFQKLLIINPTLEEEDTITHLEYDAVADYLRGEIRNKTYPVKTHRGNARARFDFDLTTNLVTTDAVEMQPIYDNGIYIFSKNINQENVDPDLTTRTRLRFQSVGWALAPGQKEDGFYFQAPLIVSDFIDTRAMNKGQTYLEFANADNQNLFNIGDRVGVCKIAIVGGLPEITNISDCGFLTGIDDGDVNGTDNTITIPLKYGYAAGMGVLGYAIFKFPLEKYTYNFFVNEPSYIWIEYATNTVHGRVPVEIYLRQQSEGYGNTLGEQIVGELGAGERLFLMPGFYCARASYEEDGHSDPVAGYEDWHTNYIARPFWICIDKRQAKQAPDLTNNIYCWNNYQGLSKRPDPGLTMFEHWQFMPHGPHIIPAQDKPDFAWYDLDNLDNYLRIGTNEKAYHTIGKGYYVKVDDYVYFCVNELELNEDWGAIIYKNRAKILQFDYATGRLIATLWEDPDYKDYFCAPPYHKNGVLHLSVKQIYPRWMPKNHRIFGIKLPATTDDFPDVYESSDKRVALVTIPDDLMDEYNHWDKLRLNPKHSELDPDGDFLGEKIYTIAEARNWKYTDRTFECEDVGTQTTPVTDMLLIGAGTKWRWDEIRQLAIEQVEEYGWEYYQKYGEPYMGGEEWTEELEAYYAYDDFKTKYQAQLTEECACKYIWKQEGWEEEGCAWRAFDLKTDTMSTLFTGYGDVAEIPEGKELEDKEWGEEHIIGDIGGMPGFLVYFGMPYYFGMPNFGITLKNPNVITSSVKAYVGGQEFTITEVDIVPNLPPEPGKCYLINHAGSSFNMVWLLFDDRYNQKKIRVEYQYRDNDLHFDKFCEDDDGNIYAVEQGSGKWYKYDGSDVSLNSMIKINETGIDFIDPQGSIIYAILNPSNLLAKFSIDGTAYVELAKFKNVGAMSAMGRLAMAFNSIFYATADRNIYFKPTERIFSQVGVHDFTMSTCEQMSSDELSDEAYTGVELSYANGKVRVGDTLRIQDFNDKEYRFRNLIFSKPMATWLATQLYNFYTQKRKYRVTSRLNLQVEPGDDALIKTTIETKGGKVRSTSTNLAKQRLTVEVLA